MPDEKPITDPEKIAAYVRSARIVYGLDGDDSGKIDNPPIVVPTLNGAKVRAWLPVAARRGDNAERRRGAGLAAGLGRRPSGLEGRPKRTGRRVAPG
jgi:hypothetical protein